MIIKYDFLRWDHDRGEISSRNNAKITSATSYNENVDEKILISSKDNKKGQLFSYKTKHTDNDIDISDGPTYAYNDNYGIEFENGIDHVVYSRSYIYTVPSNDNNIFYCQSNKTNNKSSLNVLSLYNKINPNNKMFMPIIKYLKQYIMGKIENTTVDCIHLVGFYISDLTVRFLFQRICGCEFSVNELYILTCKLIMDKTVMIDQNSIKITNKYDLGKYCMTNNLSDCIKIKGVALQNNRIYLIANSENKSHILKLSWYDALEMIGNNITFGDTFNDTASSIVALKDKIMVLFDHCENDKNYCFKYVLFKE